MAQNNKVLHGNTYCMGEWCNEKTDLISELPKEPFQTLKTCNEITYALKAGKVLSVNLSIACTPDYISYYHGIEGVMQILEGVIHFPEREPVIETGADDLPF